MGIEFKLQGMDRFHTGPVKIEWLGEVVASRFEAASVRCVTLACALWDEAARGRPLRQRDVRPFKVRVPVTYLSYLRMGDIWQGGRYLGTEAGSQEVFQGLDIGPNTTSIVTARDGSQRADGAKVYELPYDQFDSHAYHNGSRLVRVRVAEDQVLLIPVWEVLRFYFGYSGQLMRHLFTGATADQRLYQQAKRDPYSGQVDVHLAPGFGRSAACDIARLAFDPRAAQALKALISSGIKARVNDAPFYPSMSLPFEGRTDLTAQGRWLDAGGTRVFLVHHLVRCTHPFPFTSLRYHLWMRNKAEAPDPAQQLSQSPEPSASEDAAELERPAPHPGLPDRLVCFPDLANKAMKPVVHRMRGSERDGQPQACAA